MGLPPPPPPPVSFDHDYLNYRKPQLLRSSSSASLDSFAFSYEEDPIASRASFSQTSHRVSSAHKSHRSRQGNLAAILDGERPAFASRAVRSSGRRDSFGSALSSITAVSDAPDRKLKMRASRSSGHASPPAPEPTMANAFAASLAAIRRNRADTVEEGSIASNALSPVAANGKVRSRKRDSQLSAEGKEILRKAMAQEGPPDLKPKISSGRRGLFDDSTSEEDDDSNTGLFGVGVRKSKAGIDTSYASKSFRPSDLSAQARPKLAKKEASASSICSDDVSSDSDSNTEESSLFKQPTPKSDATNNVAANGAGTTVVVLFETSALRNEGRKAVGEFTFTLQSGNIKHTFSLTYMEFKDIHTRLTSAFPGISLPTFPSKHRLRNNTKPENMEKRAQEFRLYLQQLVALPEILSSEQFRFGCHIDDSFARALTNDQKPSGGPLNGAQLNRRPPRSPITPQLGKGQLLSPSLSRTESFSRRVTISKTSKGLFGLEDSNLDPESDSDTSVDTPHQVLQQQNHESAVSSTQQRKSRMSEILSSGISLSAKDTQRVKKSRSRSRISSRASLRASFASSPVAPSVTSLPPGRPHPFAGGRGDLLAAIRQGAQLKKTDPIGGGSSGVSSASTPLAFTQPSSINEAITNAMAMRRIHVEYEETKSDCDSDSDDDWD